jgi:plastocyanin
MMGKRFGTLLALAAAAAVLIPTIAFAGGGARATSTHTVTLKDIAFHPGDLSINHGDSVTWVWRDGETYDCTLHVAEGMKGKIIVH